MNRSTLTPSIEELNRQFHEIQETKKAYKEPQKIKKPSPDKRRPDKKRSKFVTVVSNVLFYMVIAGMLLSAIAFAQNNNYDKSIFGYRIYNVLSRSMNDVYPKGSMIVVKQTDPNTINLGDDVTYITGNGSLITHRVVEIVDNYNNSGARGFRTKGVNNQSADESIVYATNVLGKVCLSIPSLGMLLSIVSRNIMRILVGLVLILIFAFTIRIFWGEEKKDRKKKRLALQNERALSFIKNLETK